MVNGKSRRAVILALGIAGLGGCSSLDETVHDNPSGSAYQSTGNATSDPPQSQTMADKSASSPKESLLTWSLELEESRISATSNAVVVQSLETGEIACFSGSTGEKAFEYGPIPRHAFSTSEQTIYLLDDSSEKQDIVSIDSDSWEINWKKQTSSEERIIDSTDYYLITRSNGELSIIHNETGDRTTLGDFEFYPFHRIEIFKHFLFAHHEKDEKYRIFDLKSGKTITEEEYIWSDTHVKSDGKSVFIVNYGNNRIIEVDKNGRSRELTVDATTWRFVDGVVHIHESNGKRVGQTISGDTIYSAELPTERPGYWLTEALRDDIVVFSNKYGVTAFDTASSDHLWGVSVEKPNEINELKVSNSHAFIWTNEHNLHSVMIDSSVDEWVKIV